MPTSSQRAPPSPHKSRVTEKKQIGEGCTNSKGIHTSREKEQRNIKKFNCIRPSSQQINRSKPEENQNLYRKTKSNCDFEKSLSQKSSRAQSNKSKDKFENPTQKSICGQIGENCKASICSERKQENSSFIKLPKPLCKKGIQSIVKSNCRSQIPVRSSHHRNLDVSQVEQEILIFEKTSCTIKTLSSQRITQNQIEQKKSKFPTRPLSQKSNGNQLKQDNLKANNKNEVLARPLSECSNRSQFKRENSKSNEKPAIASRARPLSQKSNRNQENQSVGISNTKAKPSVKSSNRNQIEQDAKPCATPKRPASQKAELLEKSVSSSLELNSSETLDSRTEKSELNQVKEPGMPRRPISPSFQKPLIKTSIKSNSVQKVNRIQVERPILLSRRLDVKTVASTQISQETELCKRPVSPSNLKSSQSQLEQKSSVSEKLNDGIRRPATPSSQKSQISQEAELCKRPVSPSSHKSSQSRLEQKGSVCGKLSDGIGRPATPSSQESQISQEAELCKRPVSPSSHKSSQSRLEEKGSVCGKLNDGIRRPETPSSQKSNRIQVNRDISSSRKPETSTKSPLQIGNRVKQKTLPGKKPGTSLKSSSQKPEVVQVDQSIVLYEKENCKSKIPDNLPLLQKLNKLQKKQEIQLCEEEASRKPNCIEIEQEIVLTENSNTPNKPSLQKLDKAQIEKETQLSQKSVQNDLGQKACNNIETPSQKIGKIQIDQETQLSEQPICKTEQSIIRSPIQKLNKCDNLNTNQLEQKSLMPKKSIKNLEKHIMQNQRPISQACGRTQVREEVISKTPSAVDFECREDRINRKSNEARNCLNAYTSLIKELEQLAEGKDISNATSLSRYSTESTISSAAEKTIQVPVATRALTCNNQNQNELRRKKDEETSKNVYMYMGDIKDQIKSSVGTSIECYNVSMGGQNVLENKTLKISSVKKGCNDETFSVAKTTELIKDEPNDCSESSIYLQSTLPSISDNISVIMNELGKNLERQKSSVKKLDDLENEPCNSSKHSKKKSYFSEYTKLDSGIRKHSRNYRNIKRTCQHSLAASLLRISRETNCRKLFEATELCKLKKHFNDCNCVVCRCSPFLVESSSGTTTEDTLGSCECLVCRNYDYYDKLNSDDKQGMNSLKDRLERKEAKIELHDETSSKKQNHQMFDNLPPELITANYRDDTNFDYMLPQRLCRFEYLYGRPVGNCTSFNKKDINNLLSPSTSKNERYGGKRTLKRSDLFYKLNPGRRIQNSFDRDSTTRLSNSFDLRQDDRLLNVRYPDENRNGRLFGFDTLFDTVREILTLGRTIIHSLIRYN